MQITFLGTGTSHGIPIVGCNCPTCTSTNPKNKRYRSAVYLESDRSKILIDTPPELRLQMLQHSIKRIDAVLFTHPHADHLMGFDDLRAINRLQETPIPCYGNQMTINEISKIFDYIFSPLQRGGGLPEVELYQIDESFKITDLEITPLPILHGKLEILGYKIGKMAYLTDCSSIPSKTMELLSDIDLLIIDALRYQSHPTHMNLEQALDVIEQLGVSQALLTHISHELEHEKVAKELPDNVSLAYDGLTVTI